MKLLILGGTRFVGLHITQSALDAGHDVTLFNRGKSNPDLFPDVEKLQGDRDGGLDALRGRQWDAVIDVNGYVPRIVSESAELLADAVARYVFISSMSVYRDLRDIPGQHEDSPLETLDDETVEEVTGETYGGLKALCEKAAEAAIPSRTLIIRPGLIVGPQDYTYRFPYWLLRVSRGGEMLAPHGPDYQMQVIDGRDLAVWVIQMTEGQQTGIYNVTGPNRPLTLGEILDTSQTVAGSDVTITWADDDFLTAHEVQPWVEFPLWMPAEGVHRVDASKAIGAGLAFRPIADTIRDTLAWAQANPPSDDNPNGLKPEREAELLDKWHEQERK